MKKEAYGNVKDPRIISTINGTDKREYSRYIYAFTDTVLKNKKWYAFGKTPRKISQDVADICEAALESVMNTDFSRFDGHGTNVMRHLERMLLLRTFRTEYHDDLLELHRSQFGLNAFTTFGCRYETGFSRASGSPETSSFNGVVNKFIDFLHRRLGSTPGDFDGAKLAYNNPGIFGGDDGLAADSDGPRLTKASAMMGFTIECEPVPRGFMGVTFLARQYGPYVWSGDCTSVCDLPRTLAKFHTTVALQGIKPEEKLVEKCRSAILSDSNTPIIGPFCRRVKKINGNILEMNDRTKSIRAWNSELDQNEQYPNEYNEWMEGLAYETYDTNSIARFYKWLDSTETLDDLLNPFILREPIDPVSTQNAVCEDEVLKGTKPPARPSGHQLEIRNELKHSWKITRSQPRNTASDKRKTARNSTEEKDNSIPEEKTGKKPVKTQKTRRNNSDKTEKKK